MKKQSEQELNELLAEFGISLTQSETEMALATSGFEIEGEGWVASRRY